MCIILLPCAKHDHTNSPMLAGINAMKFRVVRVILHGHTATIVCPRVLRLFLWLSQQLLRVAAFEHDSLCRLLLEMRSSSICKGNVGAARHLSFNNIWNYKNTVLNNLTKIANCTLVPWVSPFLRKGDVAHEGSQSAEEKSTLSTVLNKTDTG